MEAEFNWNVFPQGSVVVDVGGGFGASAKFLASHAPHVSIIIQDKPEVVASGVEVWKDHSPALLDSKRVVFQSMFLVACSWVNSSQCNICRP